MITGFQCNKKMDTLKDANVNAMLIESFLISQLFNS